MDKLLETIFIELDGRIEAENLNREETGALKISPALVMILGQISLLAQPSLTAKLELAATGDLDAKIRSDHFVKSELEKILNKHNLVYDSDSELIFIPKKSKFNLLWKLKNITVEAIDPESALVSKAVKNPLKNKQLIREAIASGDYPGLGERIVDEGGDLENFF